MFNKKLSLFLLLAIALLQVNAFAKEVKKTGTTAAKFLSIGIGPRANAMGGAFTSIANDATAMYWNPAGISMLERYEATFSYTKLFADVNLNYFGVAVPMGEAGTLGFQVTALNYGDMEVTTEQFEDGTGEIFNAGSYAFGLTYARTITEDFMVGINIKYIREDIYNSSADGLAFDVGTIFKTPFWGIRFSSSISNYGTKMQMGGDDLLIRHDPDPTRAGNNQTVDAYYSTEQFDLPLKLQIGLSKDIQFLDNNRLTLSVDAAHPNDNEQYVNIGGELALLNELIFLRGGYKALGLADSQEGLTLGVGLNYAGLDVIAISVDYAYQQFDFLGNTHSFGVLLKF
ncbi:MAG: PorV/PorQ family protein [Syntrophothermus sp.]|nr:PorV/PorQ family protein [Ignavibacteriaceae bacterium]